ncbi:alanine/glycine:cation symporter family protein [Hyphococcus luteus]|uniref:Alanine glycine permease n=1 Tax=Hyphococcus luteus TaxID=2058213 RepID=A0A2S7K9N8_9PROT|nr:alanine/glycine:cation symporter family protein [Marinicaulis flavus]PQA89191.1 alanine glycine permease [Marinicaulis flavus]
MADAQISLADRIDNFLSPVSDFVSSIIFYSIDFFGVSLPLVVIWLMAAALILTVSFGFINIRGFRHAWSLILNPRDQQGAHGEISHFQALSSALSGTVGLGNIASVPVAIALGGPGAVFWMIVAGFFGMSSKFAECALAVKYRKVRPDGSTLGGPMFYIEDAFRRLGMKTLGKAAAMFFAVMAIGGSISILQVNQSHAQFANVTGIDIPVTFGVIMAAGVAYVVLGGIKRIGKVTGLLVPIMGAVYLGAGLIIIFMNIDHVPAAFETIFKSAFGLDAAGGGLVGALINGVRRATYSNEAGVGSAAIAHSAVKTNEPLTEGYVALLEPFIDTIVVCMITALVVIVTGAYEPYLYAENAVGIEITSAAYASAFAWFPYILLAASVLFAFTTLVSWAFYGAQAAAYLFGDTKKVDVLFKISLCLALSTGAAVSLSSIIDFIDSMLFGMCIPNIIALYILLPELKRDMKTYKAKYGV